MSLIWKVLRPHYWMLDRRVRETNRTLIILIIIVMGFGGQWVYENLISDLVVRLNSEQAAAVMASSLPLGLFIVLLFAMLGVGDVMYQLYLTPDLEMLMAAPVPYRTIFLTKLLQCSRSAFIPALAIGAYLAVLGMARNAPLIYYALILLLVVGAVILTTAVVIILVILLARLIPAQRVRSWMPVAVILATFVLALSQGPVSEWFLKQEDLMVFLTGALLDPGQLSLVAACLLGATLVVGLIGYRIFERSFQEGWNRFQIVPNRRVAPFPGTERSSKSSRLVSWIPAPMRYILVKEWVELRRNPRGLITLTQPFLVVVLILAPVLGIRGGLEALQPLLFWFMLVFLMLFMSVSPLGTCSMSVAQEGRNMALLRSAPISMSVVLKGKYWALWIPLGLSWVLVLLAAGLWLRFSIWQNVFLAGAALWGFSGTMMASLAIFGLEVDFSAGELKQRVPALATLLAMGMNMIYALLIGITFVWGVARLFAGNPVNAVMKVVVGDGFMKLLSEGNLSIPLALGTGQILYWLGVMALWGAAVRRLERWEEGQSG